MSDFKVRHIPLLITLAPVVLGAVFSFLAVEDPPSPPTHTPIIIGLVLLGIGIPPSVVFSVFEFRATRRDRIASLAANGAIPFKENDPDPRLARLSATIAECFGITRDCGVSPIDIRGLRAVDLNSWLVNALNRQRPIGHFPGRSISGRRGKPSQEFCVSPRTNWISTRRSTTYFLGGDGLRYGVN